MKPSRDINASSWMCLEVTSLSLEETYEELSRLEGWQRWIALDEANCNADSKRSDMKERTEADLTAFATADLAALDINDAQNGPPDLDYQITTYRTALRARAMQLSRAKVRPINILDLPLDILYTIFEHFRFVGVTAEGRQERKTWSRLREDTVDRVQAIQNARLACRTFCEIASPLLIPTIVVHLDKASLARAEKISRAPQLAAGVHGIELRLEYRPRELATDLTMFTRLRSKELSALHRRCARVSERLYQNGHRQAVDDPECPLRRREVLTAMTNFSKFFDALYEYFEPVEEASRDQEVLDYHRMLLEAHHEYRQKHEEQLRLVMDGSFVQSLASSMARMLRLEFLEIMDQMDDYLDWDWEEPVPFLAEMEEISQFLVTPHDWKTIEEATGVVSLPPATIFSELPCALAKAGGPLRELHINCFPVMANLSAICWPQEDGQFSGWDNLRAACQNLEIVRFGRGYGSLNSRSRRQIPLSADEQSYLDGFLSALLSGPCLEIVDLRFTPFGVNHNDSHRTTWYEISSVLGAANWPRLKRLLVTNVSLDQHGLERLCAGLGRGLNCLDLDSVELLHGSWVGALDTLREKITASRLEDKCEVNFRMLRGGEFSNKEMQGVNNFSLPTAGQQLILLSQNYVLGTRSGDNPLRGMIVV